MPSRLSNFGVGAPDRHYFRRRTFQILEKSAPDDKVGRVTDIALASLIVISVIGIILESNPALETAYRDTFYWLEVITVAVFSVEYILRVWSSVENDRYRDLPVSPLGIRARHMVSGYALIDLAAILPFFIMLFFPFLGLDMRMLRAVRLLRILKLTRYSRAFDILLATCKDNIHTLGAAFLVLLTTLLLASTGMYFFERTAQPIAFRSIPDAMWWAVSTLTTVGYGDVTPITTAGKIFGALITIIGVGMVALPTGILASGYSVQSGLRSETFHRKAEQALRDGVVTDKESQELEDLRRSLTMSRNTAEQIIDLERTYRDLPAPAAAKLCPHCGSQLHEDP